MGPVHHILPITAERGFVLEAPEETFACRVIKREPFL